MPRISRIAALLGLGALLVLLPSAATAAPASRAGLDDFAIESFHSDYVLTRDADGHAHLQVVETIVAVFPDFDQNKGFYRDIPEYRHGVQLHTQVESVVDEFGIPVPYTTEYYQDFYSVGLGDDSYVHGRRTYVITYRQIDVIEVFSDTGNDEFYWDVNGTGWAQPFGRVSMTLVVDPEIAPALTGESECYVFGSCDEPLVATTRDDGSVEFSAASNGLAPSESLTVAIEFAADTFVRGPEVIPPPTDGDGNQYDDYQPSWWDTVAPFIFGPAGVILAFVAGATQVADRSRRTGPSDIIVPQYTPPEGLNVMVAAYVAGYPEKAFAAQLVDLAVRGNVRLLDNDAGSRASFEAELLHANGVDELGTQLLKAVFDDDLTAGRRVPLDAGDTRIGRRLTSVYSAVDKALKSAGMQGSPRPTVLWSVLFFLAIAVAIVAGINALRSFIAIGGEPFLSIAAAGVALFAANAVWSRRSTVAVLSSRGREINDHLLGMRDYMELAEEDRIRMLQSPEGAERVDTTDQRAMVKLYEKLLPYAVIFGIEDQWAEEITIRAVAAQVPVTWYAGTGDITSWRLNSTIKNLRRIAPAPPRPAVPRMASRGGGGSSWGGWGSGSSSSGWRGSSGSSFSSGSRGGGFSGGGGGGGGGRGR